MPPVDWWLLRNSSSHCHNTVSVTVHLVRILLEVLQGFQGEEEQEQEQKKVLQSSYLASSSTVCLEGEVAAGADYVLVL